MFTTGRSTTWALNYTPFGPTFAKKYNQTAHLPKKAKKNMKSIKFLKNSQYRNSWITFGFRKSIVFPLSYEFFYSFIISKTTSFIPKPVKCWFICVLLLRNMTEIFLKTLHKTLQPFACFFIVYDKLFFAYIIRRILYRLQRVLSKFLYI